MNTKFTTDHDLCSAYARQLDNGFYKVAIDGFSEACFNDNTISELREALQSPADQADQADQADCDSWGLTPDEWHGQIEVALAAKLVFENDDMIPTKQ